MLNFLSCLRYICTIIFFAFKSKTSTPFHLVLNAIFWGNSVTQNGSAAQRQWRWETKKLCLWRWFVPAELPLIKRETGSLHFPPLSPMMLILRTWGLHHFSHQEEKLFLKWTKNRCWRRFQRFSLLPTNSSQFPTSSRRASHLQPVVSFQHCDTSLMRAELFLPRQPEERRTVQMVSLPLRLCFLTANQRTVKLKALANEICDTVVWIKADSATKVCWWEKEKKNDKMKLKVKPRASARFLRGT